MRNFLLRGECVVPGSVKIFYWAPSPSHTVAAANVFLEIGYKTQFRRGTPTRMDLLSSHTIESDQRDLAAIHFDGPAAGYKHLVIT